MKLNNLKFTKGSRKDAKTWARGFGSGKGKTAGRGQAGQNSRNNGGGARLGWNGGTFNIFRTIPKSGFTNADFRQRYNIITIKQINVLINNGAEVIDRKTLEEFRIINKNKFPIKVIGNEKLVKKIEVNVDKMSAGAQKAIQG
ncbi:MAG: 50S ribosomal protein L15 [Mycoplasmataceae bacterium]|nr:50S ribosomal protein L15 [Mycoplasmataceae bacterium]